MCLSPVHVMLFVALLCATANAADYPTRPVNLLVAFTPGGPSDVLARILGKKLEQILGQPFVIRRWLMDGNRESLGRQAGLTRLSVMPGLTWLDPAIHQAKR